MLTNADDFLGKDIPKLGFGLMRLPRIDGSNNGFSDIPIDIEQVKQMVDAFMEAGFTYFDTAFGYPGSEVAIKEALVDRYPRESYQLATKLPAWAGPKTAEEAEQMLYTSLERTGAGYFDFYLLHNIGGKRSEAFDKFGIWDYVQAKKKEGLLKHVGLSFHDRAELLDKVLTEHPEMEFVQIQVNYADWNAPFIQAGKCYETALAHGKPVIIMEPVKGGLLAEPPQAVVDALAQVDPDVSPATWALRFAGSLEGVITVLSGMSTLEQVEENIATFKAGGALDETELAAIDKAREILESVDLIGCTNCRYCVPGCPVDIMIPAVFSGVNQLRLFGDFMAAKGHYMFEGGGVKAKECVSCGQCEAVCPQGLPIIQELAAASALFDTEDENPA